MHQEDRPTFEGESEVLDHRLWRVRRRGQLIDAILAKTGDGWRVTFTRNSRPLFESAFETREQATSAAEERLRELERAGWTEHW